MAKSTGRINGDKRRVRCLGHFIRRSQSSPAPKDGPSDLADTGRLADRLARTPTLADELFHPGEQAGADTAVIREVVVVLDLGQAVPHEARVAAQRRTRNKATSEIDRSDLNRDVALDGRLFASSSSPERWR